jgi:hypothetical protein
MAFLFADIRGSTSLAEKMSPPHREIQASSSTASTSPRRKCWSRPMPGSTSWWATR